MSGVIPDGYGAGRRLADTRDQLQALAGLPPYHAAIDCVLVLRDR